MLERQLLELPGLGTAVHAVVRGLQLLRPPGPHAPCVGCRSHGPLRKGYCRLCWCHARIDAAATGAKAELLLPELCYHQLFFAHMAPLWERVPRTRSPKCERRGRPRKPDPPPAPPPGGWIQPSLFPVCRDLTRVDPAEHTGPDNAWLAWARHTAHRLGEAQGWPRKIRLAVDRALIILMSRHVGGDVVRYSELYPALQPHRLNMELTIEVLDHIGGCRDDRTPYRSSSGWSASSTAWPPESAVTSSTGSDSCTTAVPALKPAT